MKLLDYFADYKDMSVSDVIVIKDYWPATSTSVVLDFEQFRIMLNEDGTYEIFYHFI